MSEPIAQTEQVTEPSVQDVVGAAVEKSTERFKSPHEAALEAVEQIRGEQDEAADEEQEKPAEDAEQDKPQSVSAALAKIAKAEARSRKKLQAQEQRLQNMYREIEPLIKFREQLASGISNPVDAIESLGKLYGIDLSYQAYTDAIINGNLTSKAQAKEIPPEVQEEISRVKSELEEYKSQIANRELDHRVNSYKSEVLTTLQSNPEDYEFLRIEAEDTGQEPIDLIGDYVAEVYNMTSAQGQPLLLSPKEAVEKLEDYLSRKYTGLLKRSKKVKSLLGDVTPNQAAVSAPKVASKTLTNRYVASAKTDGGNRSADAARERAKAVVEQFLNQR